MSNVETLEQLIEKRDDKQKKLDEYMDGESYNQENDGYNGDYDDNKPVEIEAQEEIDGINNIITQIEHGNQQKRVNGDFEKFKKVYTSGNIISDKQTGNDILNRDMYANSISKLISKNDIGTPLTVGIFGEWGQGKSSFLDLLEDKLLILSNDSKTKGFEYCKPHIIRFDASEYNEEEKIWYSVLKDLFKAFEKEKPIKGKFDFALKKFVKSLKVNIIKYFINIIIFAIFILIYQRGFLTIIKSNIFVQSIGVFSIVLFTTNVLIPFINKQLEFIKPLSEKVNKIFKLGDYNNYLGTRETIKEDFEDIVDVWLKKEIINNKTVYKDRIIILVDELDRCSEKNITEFFNALQLILTMKGIVVVLSINYQTVCYALANNNKHYFDSTITNEQKIAFGISYLDKYINIPFYLPNNLSYKSYLNNLLGKDDNSNNNNNNSNSNSNEAEAESDTTEEGIVKPKIITFSSDEEDLIKDSIEIINSIIESTPREIKKIINLLIVSKDICFNFNSKSSNKIWFDNYILWFLFAYFNHKIAYLIINEPHFNYSKLKIANLHGDKRAVLFFNKLDRLKELNFEDIKKCNDISRCFVVDTCKIRKSDW